MQCMILIARKDDLGTEDESHTYVQGVRAKTCEDPQAKEWSMATKSHERRTQLIEYVEEIRLSL